MIGRLHVHHLGRARIADRPGAAHEEDGALVNHKRWIIDAPINRNIFETYVETQLAPTLSRGDVVSRLIPCRCRHRCNDDRVSDGIVACRA